MHHWLMKTEPSVFSIDDLKRLKTAPWDGVRNYQARNFMRDMRIGDQVLIYHSNAKPTGVAGLGRIAGAARPDPTAWDPGNVHHDPRSTPDRPVWDLVDVAYVSTFSEVLVLDQLRLRPELAGMLLFNRSRLSVQPVSAEHFAAITALASAKR